jgi:hypothetical protein
VLSHDISKSGKETLGPDRITCSLIGWSHEKEFSRLPSVKGKGRVLDVRDSSRRSGEIRRLQNDLPLLELQQTKIIFQCSARI